MKSNLLSSSCRAIVFPEADTQGRPCHHLCKPKHYVQVQKRPPASQDAGSTQLSAEPARAKTARNASHTTSYGKRTAQHQVTRRRPCLDGGGPNTRRSLQRALAALHKKRLTATDTKHPEDQPHQQFAPKPLRSVPDVIHRRHSRKSLYSRIYFDGADVWHCQEALERTPSPTANVVRKWWGRVRRTLPTFPLECFGWEPQSFHHAWKAP